MLVAVDDVLTQTATVHMLKKLGCEADAVVKGKEVVLALTRSAYNLIFMDSRMLESGEFDPIIAQGQQADH